MGGFSIWHWLIVLLVVVVIFGTKKLRNVGGDLGGAVRDFKKAMNTDEEQPKLQADQTTAESSDAASAGADSSQREKTK